MDSDRTLSAALGRITEYRGAFRLALSVPCDRHDAEAGEPCWEFPGGSRAVCGARITDAYDRSRRRIEHASEQKRKTRTR